MKLAALILCLLTCMSAQAQSKPPVTPVSANPTRVQTLDSVAALVNSEVITRSELNQRLARIERQLKQQGSSLPPREVLERQVLERMIVDKLQVQLAREQGIRVDDTTLDRTLGRIAEDNRMSLQQFRDRLEREGISFMSFRNEVRDEILATRVREREIERRIQINETDIDDYMKQQESANGKALTAQVQQTRARHILLRNADGLTDEEAQRRLNDYKQRIDSKAASFDDLARRFSRDGSATQGGDLGWLYPGDTVPEFERAMDALPPGQVSAPVQSPFGWHLILVTERRTSEVGNDRKRLIARQAVREQKLEEAVEDWLRELRDGAYVEIRLDN